MDQKQLIKDLVKVDLPKDFFPESSGPMPGMVADAIFVPWGDVLQFRKKLEGINNDRSDLNVIKRETEIEEDALVQLGKIPSKHKPVLDKAVFAAIDGDRK